MSTSLAGEDDYLSETFDPSSLTIPKLRSLLFQHSILLPSTARKADLIDAFQTRIAAQRDVLRRQKERERERARKIRPGATRASEVGVLDMRGAEGVYTLSASPGASGAPSGSSSAEDETSAPTPSSSSATKRARGRKGTRVASGAKEVAERQRSASPRKSASSPKKRSTAAAPASILSNGGATSDREGAESDGTSSAKKLKHRNSVTFKEKPEYREHEGYPEEEEADTSNFSSHNPFQSASPAPSPAVSKKRASPAQPSKSPTGRNSKSPSKSTSTPSKQSPQGTPSSRSTTATLYRNFMDPIVSSKTPPRSVGVVNSVAKRIASAGSRAMAMAGAGGTPAQDEDEEETDEEEDQDDDDDAYSQEEEEDPSGHARKEGDTLLRATSAGTGTGTSADDSSFNIQTDPSPSIHALRTKRKRQGRTSLGQEITSSLWKSDSSPSHGKINSSAVKKGRKGSKEAREAEQRQQVWTARLQRVFWATLALYAVFVIYARASESREISFCDPGTDYNSVLRARKIESEQREQQRQHVEAAQKFANQGAEEEEGDLFNFNNVTMTSFIPSRWLPQTCTSCPVHSDCSDGRFLGCNSGDFLQKKPFLLKLLPFPLSTFAQNFLPLHYLAPSCVPDTHKLVLALELGAELERLLADWHGQVLCGRRPPYEGAPVHGRLSARERQEAGALPEAHLKTDLHARMDQEQVDTDYFEQLWALGLGEYHKSGDIKRIRQGKIIEPDAADYSFFGTQDDLLFAPRAITPFACTVRLRLKSFLRRFRLLGFGLVSMLSLFLWTRRNYRKQRADSARVSDLVQIALETLQEQEYNHATQPALYPEPFLATAQLRDHVLASEHSAKARKRLWSKVSKIVEENANVRTRQAQRRGEWARVWEWIGSGGAGALSRASSRPSSPVKPDMAEKDVKPVTVSPRS